MSQTELIRSGLEKLLAKVLQLMNKLQYCMMAATGLYFRLALGTKHQPTDPVIGVESGPCQCRGDFTGNHRFKPLAAKKH